VLALNKIIINTNCHPVADPRPPKNSKIYGSPKEEGVVSPGNFSQLRKKDLNQTKLFDTYHKRYYVIASEPVGALH